MTRIRLYVDESGNPNAGEDVFVLGAAICATPYGVSEYDALRFSVDLGRRLCSRQRNSDRPAELHFSKGLGRSSEQMIGTILNGSIADRSVATPPFQLPGVFPVSFRAAVLSPKAIGMISREGSRIGEFLRASALVDILLPFLLADHPQNTCLDIVLDDRVWISSIDLLRPAVKKMASGLAVSYHFADSRRVPGLQVADIVSGVCRRHTIRGDCVEAFRIIQADHLERLHYLNSREGV